MLKALLLAGALCAALAAPAPHRAQTKKKKPAPAKPAPAKPAPAKPEDAPQEVTVTGKQLQSLDAARPKVSEINEEQLKSLLGAGAGRARPLLVNFWATWCTPCREEFPDLVKLRAQYGAERLDFVIVSLDDPTDIETAVPQFLSEVGAEGFASYLLHAADESVAINFVDPAWGGELPATFLYDRAGALVFKHKGRIKPAEVRAALDEALKDRPQQARAAR